MPVSGEGDSVRLVADLSQHVGQNPVFGLIAEQGMAYISVWGSGQVSTYLRPPPTQKPIMDALPIILQMKKKNMWNDK